MEEQQPADAGAIVRAIPVEEIARILALNPVFAQFDRDSLRAVASKCRVATFPAGGRRRFARSSIANRRCWPPPNIEKSILPNPLPLESAARAVAPGARNRRDFYDLAY